MLLQHPLIHSYLENLLNIVLKSTFYPNYYQKLSQQIILDLKGKLNFEEDSTVLDERVEQVGLALKSLGYNNTEIKNILKRLKLEQDTTLSDAVKQALKMLRS
mgnify:CR=1 FL=1